MSQNTLIRLSLILALSTVVGCSDAQYKACQNPDLHCYITADGQATCEDGYTWEDATDADNFQCVPVESNSTSDGNTGGTNDGNSSGGGSTGGDSGDSSGADDGCPPNSSLEDDGYCYCDEGYVVNEDQTACVEDDGSGGGQRQGN